ncbi:MFS transporter permease [Glaciecola sp. 1036]|uniref:MFS transporter permease n=1 Tax=Alteromonadaceae TaxID=72275 RepID=UPI003D000FC3
MNVKKSHRIGISLITSKSADLLLSPKTTLTTILSAVGAPSWMVQLLVPLREAGALLPQIGYSKLLSKVEERQKYWILGMYLQFFSSLGMLSVIFVQDAIWAGVLMLLSLTCFSFARALTSLIMKDIQGVHIDKGNRGKLLGSAGTISSAISVAVALLSMYGSMTKDANSVLIVGGIAVFCQLTATIVLTKLTTKVDTQENKIKILWSENFTQFVLVRSLLAHSALLAPIFVLAFDGDLVNILAYLIITQSAAGFVSSYLWGSLSDNNAKLSMQIGAVICLLSNAVLLFGMFAEQALLANHYFIIALYFVLSIGHNGIRTGRKVYVVDIAKGQNRTEFVAGANTVVGAVILVLGALYSVVSTHALSTTLALMTALLAVGFVLSFWLKNEK